MRREKEARAPTREERDRTRRIATYFFGQRERERETIESLVFRARLACARDNGTPDSPCCSTIGRIGSLGYRPRA